MRQLILRVVLLLIIVAVVFGLYRLLTVRPLEPGPFFDRRGEQALVFADTGTSRQAPPYTLAAFQAAAQAGVNGLYLPLQLTKDGELVVLAVSDVAQVSDGSGPVSELTLAEVQALDAGYRFDPAGDGSFPWRGRGLRILSLREVLTAFPDLRLIASLERPSDRCLAALLSAVDGAGARERVLAAVNHQRLADALRLEAHDLPTAYTEQELQAFLTTYQLRLMPFYRPAAEGLLIGAERVSRGLVEAAHSRGVQVIVIADSGLQGLDSLLALGIDGVIVNWE